jgi:hypothetical protein
MKLVEVTPEDSIVPVFVEQLTEFSSATSSL